MENEKIIKCRVCGATLVGQKSIKRGICSSCVRKGQRLIGPVLGTLGTVALLIGKGIWALCKRVIKK